MNLQKNKSGIDLWLIPFMKTNFSRIIKLLIFLLILHANISQAEDSLSASASSKGLLKRLRTNDTLSGVLFGTDNVLDSSYERWAAWKKSHYLPISIGAHNWFHANNGGPASSGYGIPSLRGTYFWYVDADPRVSLDNKFIKAIGSHAEFRFRDSEDKFRPFIDNTYWFYEAYGYVDTNMGRFKGGLVWKRFGLDWDETWWGNTQYFDGFKLDTNYGISWENTWKTSDKFKIDSFLQYFISEANISGSLVGANSQSTAGSREQNIGVVRLVPTWKLTDKSSLAIGFSGLGGDIQNAAFIGRDRSQFAWAADATYTRGNFKIFSEIDQSFGVLNPIRYVSGGPSDKITDILAGSSYRYGPVTYRVAWSSGFDANPSGRQYLFVPGATINLTKNVKFYADYVRWDVTNSKGKKTEFEDGYQLVLNWHL